MHSFGNDSFHDAVDRPTEYDGFHACERSNTRKTATRNIGARIPRCHHYSAEQHANGD